MKRGKRIVPTKFKKQRVNMEDGTHLPEHKDSIYQKGKNKIK